MCRSQKGDKNPLRKKPGDTSGRPAFQTSADGYDGHGIHGKNTTGNNTRQTLFHAFLGFRGYTETGEPA
jgi:hypothetical protein